MENNQIFLGKGWSFPPQFDQINREVVMVSDVEDIRQSIKILLSTRPGERIMRPDFGCNLNQFVFKEVSQSLFSHIKSVIFDAIMRFEARVDVGEIEIEYDNVDESVLYITIHYMVRQTNSRHNIVYPFYLLEGNNISSI